MTLPNWPLKRLYEFALPAKGILEFHECSSALDVINWFSLYKSHKSAMLPHLSLTSIDLITNETKHLFLYQLFVVLGDHLFIFFAHFITGLLVFFWIKLCILRKFACLMSCNYFLHFSFVKFFYSVIDGSESFNF